MNFGVLLALFASVIGDGCLIAAATLAASSGGSALLWGVSFGLAHAIFMGLGYSVTDSIANYSEFFADTVVLATLVVLLQHFIHHRRSHVESHSCSCDHKNHKISRKMIIFYSFIFSLHALGSGAIIRQGLGSLSTLQILVCALALGTIVGSLITTSVAATDNYRSLLMRVLDTFPGIVVGLLVFAISWVTFHMLFEVLGESSYSTAVTIIVSSFSAIAANILVHTKRVDSKQTAV